MSLNLITSSIPAVQVIRYAHLGLAVSNIHNSVDFLSKIGFQPHYEQGSICVVKNKGGLEFHVFTCDRGIDDNKNILMDYPTNKYPGHTHASFSVPHVLNTKEYFEKNGLVISGERKMNSRLASIFVRDQDRTTFEFENNHNDEVDVDVSSDSIGFPQPIDHIGIRVTNPLDRFQWYAEKLGFIQEVMKYEHNPDLIKNGPPWISRTMSGIDINFIINANESVTENILVADGVVRPGIIYACYTVADIASSAIALQNAGVSVVFDEELSTSKLSMLANTTVRYPEGMSLFLQDDDHNLLRLIQETIDHV